MSELSYIKVFLDWAEATRKLKDQEKGRLIDAMVSYAKGEEIEDRLIGNEAYVFPMFQLQIDRDQQEYADRIRKQRENGLKGGRPKKTDGSPENPKNQPVSTKTKKSQDKEKDKEEDKDNISPLPPLQGVSKQLQDAFADWLAYKRERREQYKPMGLKALETQVLNNAKTYGEQAVADLIRECMANGWRGIIWDRLRERKGGGQRDNGFQTSNPFLEMLEEERGMR